MPGEYFLWEGQTKDTGPICDVRYESNTNFNIIKRYFSVKQGICPSFFLVFVEATKKRQKMPQFLQRQDFALKTVDQNERESS